MTDRDKIVSFLADNHVLSVCTAHDGVPWAANCFYAFDTEQMAFLVMSDEKTRHTTEWLACPQVAGTVSSQESSVARLRGVQFSARVSRLDGEAGYDAAHALYVKRFPIARLHSAPLWSVAIGMAKMTDNTLGFGTKLMWARSA